MVRVFAYFIILGLVFITAIASADTNSRYADIVVDPNSGQILHSTNATSPRHPASLTKMMTLYLTFKALKEGNLKLDQTLPVSAHAASQSPDKLGLKAGQTISVRNAIMSLVTLSANDSAVVLAEALGGNEDNFAHTMTEQAASLGMKQTHFYNASGLPNPEQITTAYDMALLAMALMHEFPNFYPIFSLSHFSYGGILYHNHNHLMESYPGMDGIKTGYVQASGFNLVASAKHGETRLIGVVFGGISPTSRNQTMANLLNQCFSVLFQQIQQKKLLAAINPL